MTKISLILALAAALALPATAAASCIPQTPAQQRAAAAAIFDALVLEGPTSTGVQRFRVVRSIKGTVPRVARVATGVVRKADGSGSVTSVSVLAKRGERWRIFAIRRGTILETNVCLGSRRLARS